MVNRFGAGFSTARWKACLSCQMIFSTWGSIQAHISCQWCLGRPCLPECIASAQEYKSQSVTYPVGLCTESRRGWHLDVARKERSTTQWIGWEGQDSSPQVVDRSLGSRWNLSGIGRTGDGTGGGRFAEVV